MPNLTLCDPNGLADRDYAHSLLAQANDFSRSALSFLRRNIEAHAADLAAQFRHAHAPQDRCEGMPGRPAQRDKDTAASELVANLLPIFVTEQCGNDSNDFERSVFVVSHARNLSGHLSGRLAHN